MLNDLKVRQGRQPLMAQKMLERPTPWGDDPAGALQTFHDWLHGYLDAAAFEASNVR